MQTKNMRWIEAFALFYSKVNVPFRHA